MNRHRLPASVPAVALHALLAFAMISTASAALAQEKKLDKTFTVDPNGMLTVDADGADITVNGGDSNTVVVHIDARGSQSELDNLKLSAEPSSDGVRVEALRPGQRGWFTSGSWHVETHIGITVPRTYRVNGRTSGGDVRLENVSGPSRMRTSGGEVEAKNVKGEFEGHTSGGDVRIESMEGLVKVHTSGGDVILSGIKGDVDAETSGGDVRLTRVDGSIHAHTSGGEVRCELIGPNRGISATTSGGSVWLTLPKDIAGTVDAQSSGGHIDSDFPISTSRWSQHRLSGQINGGGKEIFVRTSGGSIALNSGK